VSVAVFGYRSWLEEWMPLSGPNVPNLLSATAIDQRMAAQCGQRTIVRGPHCWC
jgi:hypothetical protein